MSTTNINIRVDADIKQQAQEVFGSLGLDMTTAINVFLRQVIRKRGIPFPITDAPDTAPKRPRLGGWEGKFNIPDDFDAPLEDFKEYME